MNRPRPVGALPKEPPRPPPPEGGRVIGWPASKPPPYALAPRMTEARDSLVVSPIVDPGILPPCP